MLTRHKAFTRVALLGRQNDEGIEKTLRTLKDYLNTLNVDVVLEPNTAKLIPEADLPIFPQELLCRTCDLIVVVGGDGSMLNAAHIAAQYEIPVLGINRGRLGFLTDIRPDELYKISEVLAGNFIKEERFLLTAKVLRDGSVVKESYALNDVVLLPGNVAHMIEFEIYIDDQIICTQRADGMIIATPTGSTAYALSGGGPILHPGLDAIVLVPMFPHTLSSRPIVVKGDCGITLVLVKDHGVAPRVSCDGQQRIPLAPGDKIHIKKKLEKLMLIHPCDYNYFETLRQKLGWER